MSSARSILQSGTGGIAIDIECHVSNGLPTIVIVGLGNKAIEESKDRIRSALASSKLELPRKRITINLAPADVPKESTSLDLAITAAILAVSGQFKESPTLHEAFIGELGLDGSVRAVRGIIGKITAAQKLGFDTFFIPAANASQARLVPNVTLFAVDHLTTLHRHFNHHQRLIAIEQKSIHLSAHTQNDDGPFLSEVVGQAQAKRALTIAAAGGHNVFLSGAPGTGKSMLAKTLPSILPSLSTSEMLDVTHMHSLISSDFEHLVTARPFRAPHHTTSHIALVGGGTRLRPGEISLSHRGVLFLDELPEFSRRSIEALRQPLEDRYITISRARDSIRYPADFILVATANPCPCGFYGTDKPCECSAADIKRYQQKISRPILDRIDLYVSMEPIDHAHLLEKNHAIQTNDRKLRATISQARTLQAKRYGTDQKLNAAMSNHDITSLALLENSAEKVLNQAATSLKLSARSYMRTIKVARTVADLAASRPITTAHIAEALQYRNNLTTF